MLHLIIIGALHPVLFLEKDVSQVLSFFFVCEILN